MSPADLKALLGAATPGPWEHGDVDGVRFDLHRGPRADMNNVASCGDFDDGGFEKEADARLCATLRNLAPLLVELWEQVEKEYDVAGLCGIGTIKALRALREAKP